jgi:hypothetical protein
MRQVLGTASHIDQALFPGGRPRNESASLSRGEVSGECGWFGRLAPALACDPDGLRDEIRVRASRSRHRVVADADAHVSAPQDGRLQQSLDLRGGLER